MKDKITLKKYRADTLYKNTFFAVKKGKDAVRGYDYHYVEFPKPGVRIVARDIGGRVLLVRQYRHPIGRYTWEVPAGGVDGSESLLLAAKRELYEETGFGAKNWHQLGHVTSLPNVTNFEAAVFAASDLLVMPPRHESPETTEVSEFEFFDNKALHAMIMAGDLCDDKSLAALYLDEANRK